MSSVSKTHIVRRLPCGCDEAVTWFARQIIRAAPTCDLHNPWTSTRKPRSYSWTDAVASSRDDHAA